MFERQLEFFYAFPFFLSPDSTFFVQTFVFFQTFDVLQTFSFFPEMFIFYLLTDLQIVYESADMSIENSHIYSRLKFREILIWQLCNHDQGHSDKYKHKFHS